MKNIVLYLYICNLCKEKVMFKTTWDRKVMPKKKTKKKKKTISKPRFRIPDLTLYHAIFLLLEIRIIVVGIVTQLLFISCFNCIYHI